MDKFMGTLDIWTSELVHTHLRSKFLKTENYVHVRRC